MPAIFEEALAPTLEQRPRGPRAAQRLALQVETDCPEGDEAAHRAKVIFNIAIFLSTEITIIMFIIILEEIVHCYHYRSGAGPWIRFLR